MISREADDNLRKQESSSTNDDWISKAVRPSSSSSLAGSSSSSWSRLKDDPRVVRVPKAFAGKDRHSKVRTVRGLRDRRVRLTVPTAVQLYDLQDRLGLNQPSKVVDWLIDAAKHEIDELPPLQIPPGCSFHQIMASQVDQYSLKLSGSCTTTNWDDEERHDHYSMDGHNFLSRNLDLSGLTSNNNSIPYARYEPNSSLSLSHPPRSYESAATGILDDRQNLIISPEPMARSHSYFPLQIAGMNSEVNFQSSAAASSSSQQVSPIHCMNMTATLFPAQNHDDDDDQKTRETYNHFS